ncbi:molybdopterin-dependent oxidoreductase [Acuticoccus sp. MNP-M23]|uniref:nitrate reductase n=1 Tax=Acuticoccus sp. MNP-M23 TaxID=3072793 RepID=UPI0028159FF4|nr:molybdopterin-dependent oxidoreductase [Acuticoccus sp. MNP-M23]WMS43494.1 molybdopterin-dependent oxidoreductase [Acuticoccus sp. MNP-M23]
MDSAVPPPAVATTCPYCGVGCGVLARAASGRVSIKGDPAHPANFGRLCSKGTALGETVGLEGRLLHPSSDGRHVSWDEALTRTADAFSAAVREHGPDAVAFYVSGQLLTEDYYVANKLMKGFIGSANIDTNSRLCMASSVAGHKRAFGSDTAPGTYEDFEEADLVVLVGSNLAWCHPVLFQRLVSARAARPLQIVAIDPRETATTAAADLHLALKPETDVALFNGLINHLSATGRIDHTYLGRHTEGPEAALAEARGWNAENVATATGLDRGAITDFYDMFAKTRRVVTVYSQGVNQSASGTDKVNAIINAHLLTGRIGSPGMGPFSVTGQPNAMGGREVGGLANTLACHMDLEDAGHRAIVRRHWGAPRVADRPGLKAVDLFEAIHDGRIKALWVMATNPSASMPDASRVDAALAKVPFLAVSDVVSDTDTLRHADVALPAAAWGEKDGTVTNSERRISRQRAFLPLPGEARPDWAIVADVARRMGFDGFDYASPAEIFAEHAALSAAGNEGQRDFDIGGLADLGASGYARLQPQQWPIPVHGPRQTRFFAAGGFYRKGHRARLVPTPFVAPEPRQPRYPFILNTGRVRDQWHTMTRTGRSPTLSAHLAEPFAELHPDDAAALGITAASLVCVESPLGMVTVRALLTPRQQRGGVFVPIHWTDATSANARVDNLVTPHTDPVSGQPALKSARVAVRPFPAVFYGYAVSTRPLSPGTDYFARATLKCGEAVEFAALEAPADLSAFAASLLKRDDLSGVVDSVAGTAAFAAFDGDRLAGAVYLAPRPVGVSRAFVARLLGQPAGRAAVLAGRPGADQPDPGPTVCACFQVGANQIRAAALAGAGTVAAIGETLSAGTNCGSCRTEIAAILKTATPTKEDRHDADARALAR